MRFWDTSALVPLITKEEQTPRTVLRTGDAIQLAAALLLVDDHPEELPFVTLDADLARAAREEGFLVVGSSGIM